MVSSTPRPHFTPGKDPVPIVQEAGWAPEPVWTGGKSRPTGIRSQTIQPVVSRLPTELPGPYIYINGKCKVTPLQARCGPEGVEVYHYSSMTAALEGVSGQQHAPAALTPGKDPVPILQEVGWTPGPVWTGGKSRLHRDSIPDRPARNQSLY